LFLIINSSEKNCWNLEEFEQISDGQADRQGANAQIIFYFKHIFGTNLVKETNAIFQKTIQTFAAELFRILPFFLL